MNEAQIEVLRFEIAKLAIAPGEVLVVRVPDACSPQEASSFAQAIQQVLPNTAVLIASSDVVFSTISRKVLCKECTSINTESTYRITGPAEGDCERISHPNI